MVFYSREEGPFADNELGIVLAEDAALLGVDLAVCLEPSDNRLALGAVGSLHATVTFEGTTSHSARPWQGQQRHPPGGGAFLAELDALVPREVTLDGPRVPRGDERDAGVGRPRGATWVPDRFELNINHRFAADQSIAEAQAEVGGAGGGSSALSHGPDLSPAAPPHAAHPLVKALIDSGVAGVEPKQAWTDVARFAQEGVAAVNLGPGTSAQAHQRNEHTSLTTLREGNTIFRRWLDKLAVGPG